QVPVGVAHRARRLDDDRVELDVRQLTAFPGERDLVADGVDREIAQQRLRELEVHVRRDLRAEGRKQVVRGDALVVPVRRVAGAPGQSLAQARAREEVAVGDAVRTAGERVG